MKIEDRAWPCMLPFIKRARERRAKEKRFWFVERGSSLHLVVVTSSSLSAGSDAPTHPSDVIPARHQHSCERERARARAIRLRHAKRSTTARTWIVFVFLFLPCSPVSQVHSRVQTRRDETRLFSNEPLLPRLPIADSKIDPPFPEGGGRIRIGAKDDELDEDGRGTVSSFSLLWDQIWLGLWLRNLELISSFFFFILESFSFGFILIFERQIRG